MAGESLVLQAISHTKLGTAKGGFGLWAACYCKTTFTEADDKTACSDFCIQKFPWTVLEVILVRCVTSMYMFYADKKSYGVGIRKFLVGDLGS